MSSVVRHDDADRLPASTRPDVAHYVRGGRRFGAFSRTIALPPGIDAQAIKAQTRDGVVEA